MLKIIFQFLMYDKLKIGESFYFLEICTLQVILVIFPYEYFLQSMDNLYIFEILLNKTDY